MDEWAGFFFFFLRFFLSPILLSLLLSFAFYINIYLSLCYTYSSFFFLSFPFIILLLLHIFLILLLLLLLYLFISVLFPYNPFVVIYIRIEEKRAKDKKKEWADERERKKTEPQCLAFSCAVEVHRVFSMSFYTLSNFCVGFWRGYPNLLSLSFIVFVSHSALSCIYKVVCCFSTDGFYGSAAKAKFASGRSRRWWAAGVHKLLCLYQLLLATGSMRVARATSTSGRSACQLCRYYLHFGI